jgi:hypothetical protein
MQRFPQAEESASSDFHASGNHLGQVEQIIDDARQVLAGTRDIFSR